MTRWYSYWPCRCIKQQQLITLRVPKAKRKAQPWWRQRLLYSTQARFRTRYPAVLQVFQDPCQWWGIGRTIFSRTIQVYKALEVQLLTLPPWMKVSWMYITKMVWKSGHVNIVDIHRLMLPMFESTCWPTPMKNRLHVICVLIDQRKRKILKGIWCVGIQLMVLVSKDVCTPMVKHSRVVVVPLCSNVDHFIWMLHPKY